jgi:hypothetical protein
MSECQAKDPAKVSSVQWLKIADGEINHYQGLVEQATADGCIRVGECLNLIHIWKAVKMAATDGKGYDDLKAYPAMRQEMSETVIGGQWDDVLSVIS